MKVVTYMLMAIIALVILMVWTWITKGAPSIFGWFIITLTFGLLIFRVSQYKEDAQ